MDAAVTSLLIVDDDVSLLSALSRYLADSGFRVASSSVFEDAKEHISTDCPDVVITDVRLGAFNGLQLIAMSPRPIPAIVTTGFPDPVLETEARQFGAKFLLKPIEPAGLLTLVAEMLRPA